MFYYYRKKKFYKKWKKHRTEVKRRVLEEKHLQDVTDIKFIPEKIKQYYSENGLDITEALINCLQFEEELIHTEQVELSRCMTDLGSQIYKVYITIVLQFGYLMLFGAYFPSSVFICFITNLLIIALIIRSLNTHIRRTLSKNMRDISIWNKVINFVGYAGVFYNIFLLLVPVRNANDFLKDIDDFLLWEIVVGIFGFMIFLKFCIG